MDDQNVHVLERDQHNRIVARYGKYMSLGIKMLSESDSERIARGVHAYGVLDVVTELGPIRIRDIRVRWSSVAGKFQVHWKQWNTGKVREGKPEYLDVAGPQDRETRERFRTFVLDVFMQIRNGVALPASPVLENQLSTGMDDCKELATANE